MSPEMMVAARQVLALFREAGIEVRPEGERVRVVGGAGLSPAATERLVALLTEHRDTVRDYLNLSLEARTFGCRRCGRHAFPNPEAVCYWCRCAELGRPHGPPCDGCGEACEWCLGVAGEHDDQLEADARHAPAPGIGDRSLARGS